MRTVTLAALSKSIQAKVADNFLDRFLGLMGRKAPPQNHGLLLSPCNSIHMMFMRFAIDAIFLDRDNRIVKIVPHLRPWLGLAFAPGAHACIELPSGTVKALGWQEGMKLSSSSEV